MYTTKKRKPETKTENDDKNKQPVIEQRKRMRKDPAFDVTKPPVPAQSVNERLPPPAASSASKLRLSPHPQQSNPKDERFWPSQPLRETKSGSVVGKDRGNPRVAGHLPLPPPPKTPTPD
ncbi:hypothetical protein CC1G_06051 [Coprinopsis cinerea okayama7|uniref:Uncharacterized protein n=1 Tax=Coprinopsis cinerea (strain Okayama-7 / 130 / ATCC MYA-4618 / FGSC 9003) TaxID=240176 RepID=A8N4H4_COPC7|nr:hypothetical protein CC1G_06051 [Coprinopsis cinerea okayama7\|eukprot:XP_001829842.1 hypothetical protein CC1G_06051 [Coprinopsis cinerea okayama7\